MVSTLQTAIIRAQNHKSSFDVKILEFGLNCFCETRKRWPFPHLTRQCKDKVFYLIEFFLRQILTTAYSFSQPQSKLLLGILDFQHALYSLNLHESLMHWLKVHNYIFFCERSQILRTRYQIWTCYIDFNWASWWQTNWKT